MHILNLQKKDLLFFSPVSALTHTHTIFFPEKLSFGSLVCLCTIWFCLLCFLFDGYCFLRCVHGSLPFEWFSLSLSLSTAAAASTRRDSPIDLFSCLILFWGFFSRFFSIVCIIHVSHFRGRLVILCCDETCDISVIECHSACGPNKLFYSPTTFLYLLPDDLSDISLCVAVPKSFLPPTPPTISLSLPPPSNNELEWHLNWALLLLHCGPRSALSEASLPRAA